VRDAV
jgi:hypothetical protein